MRSVLRPEGTAGCEVEGSPSTRAVPMAGVLGREDSITVSSPRFVFVGVLSSDSLSDSSGLVFSLLVVFVRRVGMSGVLNSCFEGDIAGERAGGGGDFEMFSRDGTLRFR